MPKPLEKEYLGDAVYLADDGHHLVMTAENGPQGIDTIFIEPSLLPQLERYIQRFKKLRE